MKSDEMSWFKHVLSLSVIIIFAGFLFYLYDSEYRGDKIATEEQLLDISHEIPCAGEAFWMVLRNNLKPLTLRSANKIASECNERNKQLQVLSKTRSDEG
ncbi:hypothetical protein OHJ17_25640 (plasmid) [Klebsiella sp. KP20-425-1]|uniref:Uncharacterized protein n=1 Tax=Klebsiella pneumoniae TaxID=573 RepID=A0A6M3HCV1_KLEPN|nr:MULTISPECIES: hypothetical protein [Klebsiella]HDX8900856.1 hypothetical protein [Klebsiella michiganensis]MBN8064630.1 hypothetical protein [Klebsiella pneumoniae]QIS32015.1 hypothetical protein [Klebsiella pneumoniae]QIS32147.1 hypothetical protein [Klebsiella pneumoniae]QJS02738.1 hypothetical protein [Klebsiella pneumoniae]